MNEFIRSFEAMKLEHKIYILIDEYGDYYFKIPNNIMIELKYIKKKEYSEKLLSEKIEEGKGQLKRYSEDERIENVIKYLVVFVGNDLKVIEEV